MSDDSNIRALFSSDHVLRPRTPEAEIHSDVERRVVMRRDIEGTDLTLLTEEEAVDLALVDDQLKRVRELPIDAETVKLRAEAALLRQEHKDLDDSVAALESMPLPDQILIARLKTQKIDD